MTAELPDAHVPVRQRRRWRRWIILSCVLAVVFFSARFTYLRLTRKPTPRPGYWAARIEAIDPPEDGISESEALRLLAQKPWEGGLRDQVLDLAIDLNSRLTRTLPRSPNLHPLLFTDRSFKRARESVLEGLKRGWVCSEDGSGASVSDSAQWLDTLAAHSIWASSRGDWTTAEEDWRGALHLTRQTGRSRTAVAVNLQASWEAAVADAIGQAALAPRVTVNTRQLMLDIAQLRPRVKRPADLLEGERLRMHFELECLYVREGGDWLAVSEAAHQYAVYRAVWTGVTPNAVSRWWNLTSPLYHSLERARSEIDRRFASLKPHAHVNHRAEYFESNGPAYGDAVLMGGIGAELWVSEQVLYELLKARRQLDAAVTDVALTIYRARNDRYPERLEELVPDLLPHVPLLPFSDQPMGYEQTGKSYRLDGRYYLGAQPPSATAAGEQPGEAEAQP